MPKFTVPFYSDDDEARIQELDHAVVRAAQKKTASAGEALRGGDPLPDEEMVEAQKAHDDFVAEVEKRPEEEWVLESIGFGAFRSLLRDHPVRKIPEAKPDGTTTEVDHPEDAKWGVDLESFPEALLLYSDPEDPDLRTIISIKQGRKAAVTDPAAIRKRVKRLSQGQFSRLWTEAFALNRRGVTDPKLDRYSAVTARLTET